MTKPPKRERAKIMIDLPKDPTEFFKKVIMRAAEHYDIDTMVIAATKANDMLFSTENCTTGTIFAVESLTRLLNEQCTVVFTDEPEEDDAIGPEGV